MGQASGIEWTDATWNSVRGCSRVSPGCENCYAEKVAARFHAPGLAYEGLTHERSFKAPDGRSLPLDRAWNGVVRMVPEHLADPLRWTKPRRIFVNSMSDLFHEKLSNEDIAAVFGVMAAAPQHTFQVLTKRAERMRAWFAWLTGTLGSPVHICWGHLSDRMDRETYVRPTDPPWPLPNVHLGVSVEDQQRADERIPDLLRTPAAVRFISYEPALGPVDWSRWIRPKDLVDGYRQVQATFPSQGPVPVHLQAPGVDWVIVGGESGHGARTFDVRWARSVVDRCKTSGVACFVKQLGAKAYFHTPYEHPIVLKSKKGGDMAEWPEDLRVRLCAR